MKHLTQQTRSKIAILLFALGTLIGILGPCVTVGIHRSCYSDFPGCEETMEAISTAAAQPKGW